MTSGPGAEALMTNGSDGSTKGGVQRREFLRTGGRWAAAGVIAGVPGWGVVKGLAGDCRRARLCEGCPVFEDGCDRPEVRAVRRSAKAGQEGQVIP